VFDKYTNFAGPSSGTFGTENALDQNKIISSNIISGPFSFNANGNQTMDFTINDGLNINTQQNNGHNENLYLPITTSNESYILGGYFSSYTNTNIGISNSTYGYYAVNPVWTNGVFDRGACNNIYLTNAPGNGCGASSTDFYDTSGQFLTYSMYSLNGNTVTITFPDGPINKVLSETLNGASYNFTIETSSTSGPFYYLAETSYPVQLEICNPPYSATNTITCTT